MTQKERMQMGAASVALDRSLKYIKKNPDENLLKLINTVQGVVGSIFPAKNFDKFRDGAADPNNVWRQLALNIINEVDYNIVKKFLLALGFGAAYLGTKAVRKNREIYKCNIPFQILLDPTSACNMGCKGCWASEYDKHQELSLDEMRDIVRQAKELGTHFFMFTGGEPLIRKKDIITLCDENPDCAFLAFTNGTLVDEELCGEIRRVGNIVLALSIEGSKENNDARRGIGAYEKVMSALDLLKENKCLFGISVCYTSENIESVTSDDFMDLMIEKGVRFGWYFCYMPVGKGADKKLIPSVEQRKNMYYWLRKTRNSTQGKPLFVIDFQNDAEYVGGCIAGGRNYFHINSAGDIEPCVFIHYSDSNIRTHTLVEALKNPLFTEFYHGQPFNDNHLRPCPMLENPDCLRSIVNKTGAKSTDLEAPEDVETLCSRCDKYAAHWAPEAKDIWERNPHPNPKTQFYRDTPEAKAEAEAAETTKE